MILCALLAGCAAKDHVIFVTATDIDLGYDAALGTVNIGYDRNELVLGPDYVDTGALPPVSAVLESNLSVLTPVVHQRYATGCAAAYLTKKCDPTNERTNCPVTCAEDRHSATGQAQAMVFGTSTNFGFKVSFVNTATQAPVPRSVKLGYNREEFSVIPLQPDDRGTHRYGSIFALIDLDKTKSDSTDVQLNQAMATGIAAEGLAAQPEIQNYFSAEYRKAVTNVRNIPAAGGGR